MPRDLFSAIYLADHALAGARMRRTRSNWTALPIERMELANDDGEAQERSEVRTDAPHEVRRFSTSFQGEACICLPSRLALFQHLSVPMADDDEVASMTSLQLEERKALPLPTEEMTIALETLERDGDEVKILAAAVATGRIDEIPSETGLSKDAIRRIDIGILAALCALRDDPQAASAFAPGRRMILLQEPPDWTLAVLDSGNPVLVRCIGRVGTDFRPLLRAIRLSMIQAEAEQGLIATEAVPLLCVAPGPEEYWREPLAHELGADVTWLSRETDALCAEGAARRNADKESFNLVPNAWREELSEQRQRRGLLQTLVVGVALWILAAAALFLGPKFLDKAIASEERSLAALSPAISSVSNVQHRVRTIRTYMDRSLSPLEVLREVCLLLPDGVTLTSLRYRRDDARLVVAASAISTARVYDFKNGIDGSEMFVQSQLTNGPTTNTRTGSADFELTILLNDPEAKGEATP